MAALRNRQRDYVTTDDLVNPGLPVITALNHDLGDPAGGGQNIVISGTSLSGATSVHFGATAATIVANTYYKVVVTLPAKTAGVTTVKVTTGVGDSNTPSFEFWAPSTEASCTLLCRAPNYAVAGGNGTWTADVGTSPTATGTDTPTASGGAPFFGGSQNLTCDTIKNLFNLSGPNSGSFMMVLNSTNSELDTGIPYEDPPLFMDVTNGAVGAGFSSDGGFEAFVDDGNVSYVSANVAQINVTNNMPHCSLMRFNDSSVSANVDAAGWVTTSLSHGIVNTFPDTAIRLGENYNNTKHLNTATMQVVAFFNVKISDAVGAKLYKWSRQQHSVA
jgi:hypothetical protein